VICLTLQITTVILQISCFIIPRSAFGPHCTSVPRMRHIETVISVELWPVGHCNGKKLFTMRWETTNSQAQVVLQKLRVPLFVKQFSAFYGTQRLITVCTRSRHLSLSSSRWIHSTPYQPTLLRYTLTVSSHRSPGLQSGLFPSDPPATSLSMFLFSPTRATCPAHLILCEMITRIVYGEGYKSWNSTRGTKYVLKYQYASLDDGDTFWAMRL